MSGLRPDDLVRRILPAARLRRELPGGEANRSFHVSIDGRGANLRVYLQEDWPRFHAELQTLIWLEGVRARAPRLLSHGVLDLLGGAPYMLLSWIEGRTLAHHAATASPESLQESIRRTIEEAERISALVGVPRPGYFHVGDEGPVVEGDLHHDLERYTNVIREYDVLPIHLLEAAIVAATRGLDDVRTPDPRLVHPDLKPANVIVAQDEPQTFLIDWELAVGGHPALAYGGLLAEGCADPAMARAISRVLGTGSATYRRAARTAGLLRLLEVASYLPHYAGTINGRKVRPDRADLSLSLGRILEFSDE